MRRLTINEITQVSGGFWEILPGWLAVSGALSGGSVSGYNQWDWKKSVGAAAGGSALIWAGVGYTFGPAGVLVGLVIGAGFGAGFGFGAYSAGNYVGTHYPQFWKFD